MPGPIDPRLWSRASATKTYMVAGVVVGTVTSVVLVAQAWLLAKLISTAFHLRGLPGDLNAVLPGSENAAYPLGGLAPSLGALGGIIAIRAVLMWFNSWLAHRSAARVKSQLRTDIIAARLASPHDATLTTGQLVQVVTKGLDNLDGYFGRYLPQLALAITVPAVVGTAILVTDWESTLVVILTLPLIPLFMILIGLATQAKMDRSWRTQSRLGNHFNDLVVGLPTLQAFGRAAAQRKGLKINEGNHRAQTMSTLRVSFLSGGVLELVATYSVALVAVPIGLQLAFGHMDLMTGLFVLILVPEVYLPVRQVGVHYHDSVDGITAAEEAFAAIDAGSHPAPQTDPANPSPANPSPANPSPAGIIFDAVTVGYSENMVLDRHSENTVLDRYSENMVLDEFCEHIAPGEVVALVGPSGCGKSTALHVLMGFLTPASGTVHAGGMSLGDPRWRRQFAWVGQTPGMINGTVADNVRLGDPDASDDALRNALLRAGAGDMALGHHVGDGGEGLSAGERRRVAIARALLRVDAGSAWMILDEPTAGLDADTEASVIETLRGSGTGVLVVTHRPAVMEAADRVITMERAEDRMSEVAR